MQAEKRPEGAPQRRAPTPLVNELLRAGAQNDAAGFDSLFDVWLAAVFARASASRRDREAAEELTRRVMLDAVRAAASRL